MGIKIVRVFVFLFIVEIFSSCEEEISSSIPECEVYVKTNYNEYVKLRTINNSVSYINGSLIPSNFSLGYGGVLIYRDLDGNIRSCDLSCPVEALRTVRVDVNMPFAVCPECGSKFDLSYGFAVPVSGPAKESLHIYSNVIDNGTAVIVSN